MEAIRDGAKKYRAGRIKLPTTEREIVTLTEKICEDYGFQNRDKATVIVCQAIQHLPRDCGWSTPSYFADCIRKSLAHEAARSLGGKVSGDIIVEEYRKAHRDDPNNQQIVDEIKKLADQGVPQAKAFYAEIEQRSNGTQPN